MEILDYTEKRAEDTLAYLRSSYDHLTERLHNVITGLVGGAGAIAVLALTRYADGGAEAKVEWVGLASLALAWCLVAVFAALRGAPSNELSPGNGPTNIGAYHQWWVANPPAGEADPQAHALRETRKEELRLQQKRIRAYEDACTARARVLDLTFRLAALSLLGPPIAAGVVLYACR